MIGLLRGQLIEKEPTRVVVECGGIGFELRVPLSTSRHLPECGAPVLLQVVMLFSRNGPSLFGFASADERDCFRMLTSVSGIGPKAGLNMLSRFSPREIMEIIAGGRTEVMRTVPGIGSKRAESIIKRLRDEAGSGEQAEPLMVNAMAALVSLGLTRKEAAQRLAMVKLERGIGLEELLKLVLSCYR